MCRKSNIADAVVNLDEDAQPVDSDKSKGDHPRGDRKDKKDDSADEQVSCGHVI